jgi:hypothetical protein
MKGRAENRLKAALDVIADHQDLLGYRPFSDLNSGYASDRCAARLGEAKALLVMLTAAFRDSGELVGHAHKAEVSTAPPDIVARALEGITSLIDMSTMALYADDPPAP